MEFGSNVYFASIVAYFVMWFAYIVYAKRNGYPVTNKLVPMYVNYISFVVGVVCGFVPYLNTLSCVLYPVQLFALHFIVKKYNIDIKQFAA